ncbi:hypothetical protein [Phyllobacterium zundukense]|uniref:Uncharacterized protein n=1 Tax=Phyllobacterium zundukense TaxID=1867719 RepID=A0ACD4CVS2_9HYPH|nr:hypothetical protein [Phyllobacterium zundukense]UXN57659.1 hypothetical protein N8E88_02270 [Phyllobacterium zundukense]
MFGNPMSLLLLAANAQSSCRVNNVATFYGNTDIWLTDAGRPQIVKEISRRDRRQCPALLCFGTRGLDQALGAKSVFV